MTGYEGRESIEEERLSSILVSRLIAVTVCRVVGG